MAIFHHVCLLFADLFAPYLLVLTKKFSLGAVAMISVKRKLLQAINTSFSRHFPEYSMFGHFWPFFTICACLWATPWTHLRFYWQKCYHWVRLQWNLRRESYSRLLPPHFPIIPLIFHFFAIFGLFWPLFAIFHHLCLLVGHPLTPSPLLLTKMLSVGAVAMISTKRESYFRLLSPQFPTNDLTCEIAINA